MERIIKKQYKLYPESEMADWFKLFCQSEFGNAHIPEDKNSNFIALKDEIEDKKSNKTDIEDIGNGNVRVHLGYLKKIGLSQELFTEIMMQSRLLSKGTREGFSDKVKALEKAVKESSLPITEEEFYTFKESYYAAGCRLISHSERYKALYNPSYRVIRAEYANKMKLWAKVEKLQNKARISGTTVNIAIDGKSTAGKSYLGDMFSKIFDCNVIHMDHFFLQSHQRTMERLLQPGGNIDYERFQKEVIPNLKSPTDFTHHAYNCHTNEMSEIKICAKTLNIIEGAYSMHPYFGDIYDLRIFMDIDKETQFKRILKRSGELYKSFTNRWIPSENEYIESFKIKDQCDFIFKA
ncbi:MAG TPA: hypothetical protein P5064_01240 [Clostridia bacterium]|jgi:uridine kinase|nr:hypothetical protein [Clostridiaceae bacterium]HOF27187.1 hypothetical protein [Clostridia bacterium]HOM34737.1 hypothetical protein [Clostridia bacterium]HOR89304.1 hypothetical protein [Clostridia bacterium]HOT70274.1 hypothetical protein [Clostridia bacterium]